MPLPSEKYKKREIGDRWTDEDGNSFEIDEKGQRHLLSPGSAKTKVENTAKPPTAADLEDKPEDSPLVLASKKRKRAAQTVGNIDPSKAADAIERKK